MFVSISHQTFRGAFLPAVTVESMSFERNQDHLY